MIDMIREDKDGLATCNEKGTRKTATMTKKNIKNICHFSCTRHTSSCNDASGMRKRIEKSVELDDAPAAAPDEAAAAAAECDENDVDDESPST